MDDMGFNVRSRTILHTRLRLVLKMSTRTNIGPISSMTRKILIRNICKLDLFHDKLDFLTPSKFYKPKQLIIKLGYLADELY